jgi:sarcosine oxidase
VKLFDVIVVGAGVHGASSALALARAGYAVLLLERFEVGHARGSSHGESRIIRRAYAEAEYSSLAASAFSAWRDLEAESGERLLHPCKHLDLAHSGSEVLRGIESAMTQARAPFERLDDDALRTRYPQFRLPHEYAGLLDPNAGILEGTRAVRILVTLSKLAGVEVREHAAVRSVEITSDGVRASLDDEQLEAGALVLTAGAWMNTLLNDLGTRLPLKVFRTQAVHFRPSAANTAPFQIGTFPLFYDHHSSVYGFPMFGGQGLKIGDQYREPVDPDQRGFEAIPHDLERLVSWVNSRLPGVSSQPEQVQTCLYTDTPDADFVVDRVPGARQVVTVSACSGHGFKFAPIIGEMVVGLLNASDAPARFRWERRTAVNS